MLIIPSLIFGILSAIFALTIEIAIDLFFSISLLGALILAGDLDFKTLIFLLGIAAIEELSKYLFIQLRIKRFPLTLPSAMWKNIILGSSFGIGFAAIEILLMFYTSFGFLSLWMALSAAALHILTSVILTIYFLSLSQKTATRLSVIALVILLHMLYNMFVIF
jgi:hypothetical protein